jgi:hypothetical protein
MTHNIALLFGHADDTLVAWQQACGQAAEALRPQHESERLAKALALAQDGAVVLEDDGTATVQGSGTQPYTVSGALCDCPDAKKRGAPCKHALALAIHQQAMALLAPSASAALQPAATTPPPSALAQKTRQVRPPSAERWDVREAPASCCLRLRVGELEIMYTMRDVSDAELTGRVQHLVPWVQDLLDQARERQAQLAALRQQRQAATAVPAAPPQPPAPTPAPADLLTLRQQAVQQALATANGQAPSTPPPAAPAPGTAPSSAAPDDQHTGVCSLHQAAMTRHTDPDSGDTWSSHYLEDEQRYCKGARPTRRNGHRR